MERIAIPEEVKTVILTIKNAGFEAYLVGGCVRDLILGIQPNDFDICTSALPEEIIKVFDGYETILTGIRYGTVTVIVDSKQYEITTYRKECNYADGRHPSSVEFSADLYSDLSRRDFTINAIAYDGFSDTEDLDGFIDPFHGIDDILDRRIRCVGNPDERFQEDALRIIRCLRFAIRFRFGIEENTFCAMERNAELIKNLSAERISSELSKTIKQVDDMSGRRLGGKRNLSFLLSLIDTYVGISVSRDIEFISLCIDYSDNDLPTCLAAIFDDSNIENILRTLKFSNNTIKRACAIREFGYNIVKEVLLRSVMKRKEDIRHCARKFLNELSYDLLKKSIVFAEAMLMPKATELVMLELNRLSSAINACFENGDVYELKRLAINGDDLSEVGCKGKNIGLVLVSLLNKVMRDELTNDKDVLIDAYRNMGVII